MKRFLALAALACAAPRPALAKDPDIPFAEFRLDNGLRVIVHEDHKAPIVAVTSGTTSARRTRRRAEPDSRTCSST